MDRDPQITVVYGKLTTYYRPNFCQVSVAAQLFEYKIFNRLDRSTGSAFGFIDVLPSAFLAYRYAAVKTKEHSTPMDPLGPLLGNMNLAEDRILRIETVAQLNSGGRCNTAKAP